MFVAADTFFTKVNCVGRSEEFRYSQHSCTEGWIEKRTASIKSFLVILSACEGKRLFCDFSPGEGRISYCHNMQWATCRLWMSVAPDWCDSMCARRNMNHPEAMIVVTNHRGNSQQVILGHPGEILWMLSHNKRRREKNNKKETEEVVEWP